MKTVCAALALLAIAPAAAADRLFPTDVLGAGEGDSSFTAGYAHAEASFGQPFAYETEVEETFGVLDFRAGLGGGAQVGATVPYLFSGEACVRVGASEACDDAEADWGSASVFADWRFAGDARSPFAAALHLQYDTNSGADDSEAYEVGVTAGGALAPGLRGYLGVARELPQTEGDPDAWALEAGLYADAGPLRIVPKVFYTRYDAEEDYSSFAAYGAELAAHIALDERFTLIPAVAYSESELPDYQGMSFDADISAWAVGLTLYAMWGGTEEATRRAPVAKRRPAARPAPAAPAESAAAAVPEPATAPEEPATTPAAPAAAAPQPATPVPAPTSTPTSTQMQAPVAGPYTLPNAAPVYPGPRADAQPLGNLDAGTTLNLKLRMQNSAGIWWFAEAPDRKGWLREADLR